MTLESDSNGTGTELEDVLETIEKQQYVSPKDLKRHFGNIFVVDALLNNFDRHNGNRGDSCSMKVQGEPPLRQSMTVAAVCCRKRMRRS